MMGSMIDSKQRLQETEQYALVQLVEYSDNISSRYITTTKKIENSYDYTTFSG